MDQPSLSHSKKNNVQSHQEKHHRLDFQGLRCMDLDFVGSMAWTSCDSSGKALLTTYSLSNMLGNITCLRCSRAGASREAFRETRRQEWVRSSCIGSLSGNDNNFYSCSVKWESLTSFSFHDHDQHFQLILRSSILEWKRTPVQNSPTPRLFNLVFALKRFGDIKFQVYFKKQH